MAKPAPLPETALLQSYAATPGGHTDSFATDAAGEIGLAEFVTAFYTTPIFRLERLILRLLARRPSTDADVSALAQGTRDQFAVWTVEARSPGQLLLRELSGATRSWLMVSPGTRPGTTRLWFGSAVVPRSGQETLGRPYRLLMGAHTFYSRALLASAKRRLARS